MRKRLMLTLVAAIALAALPASAQNQSQIEAVKRGQSCPGCNLFQGDFSLLERGNINLSNARLRQSNLSLSTLNRARFDGADMRDVEAYGGVFNRARFNGANLTNASFVGTYLQGANFTGASLQDTNLSGADLSGATGLTQAQINRACGDENTRLPSGLRIRAC